MVGTRPGNVNRHPGHIMLPAQTRAPRRTPAQVKADKKASDMKKADAEETQTLLLAKIAALEAMLEDAEVKAQQALPVSAAHAAEDTRTTQHGPGLDDFTMDVDEDEPEAAASQPTTTARMRKATRADVDAVRQAQITAESSAKPSGKRKLDDSVEVGSNKKAKAAFPTGVAIGKVKNFKKASKPAHRDQVDSCSSTTTTAAQLSSASIKADPAVLKTQHVPAHQVVFGGYVDDDKDDTVERPTPVQPSRVTNNTTVGIELNKAAAELISDMNPITTATSSPRAQVSPPTSSDTASTALPLQVKVPSAVGCFCWSNDDPWGSTDFTDWNTVFGELWIAAFPQYPAGVILPGTAIFELGRAKLYTWRNAIGNAGVKAIQAYVASEFPPLANDASDEDIDMYAAERAEFTRDLCKKGLGPGYPFLSIAVRTAADSGKLVHAGRFQNQIMLRTFLYHFNSAMLPFHGSTDPIDMANVPTGALALSAASLERALGLFSTGEYKKSKTNNFTFESWGFATGRYAVSVKKLKPMEWANIFAGASALARADSVAGYLVNDSDNESTDDRANIMAAESDDDEDLAPGVQSEVEI
ncbi:hypothetical protein EUX98_g8605 [Antrodiella citrinella]|uniref:Uncharacterized protein n=1 Tax=Antrodiella citrinella TaxID=2447956 RepID=A0A4S4M551_9APHY|nr:hypothetical protein EUX98_g8605 [Antrodiella citrinella]